MIEIAAITVALDLVVVVWLLGTANDQLAKILVELKRPNNPQEPSCPNKSN